MQAVSLNDRPTGSRSYPSTIGSKDVIASHKAVKRIALLGSFPPRQCGIATFTADLARAVSKLKQDLEVHTIAVSDRAGYEYSSQVSSEISAQDPSSYTNAAEHINRGGYDVLSLQHEYGIFGGEAGAHLMETLRATRVPVVTTLHTVLKNPTAAQREVMDELIQRSARLVVMSQGAVEILHEVHSVDSRKIDVIPHGIPTIPQFGGQAMREKLGVTGPMILTFGLLSRDKGIEYMILAMPGIVRRYPNAVYFVAGVTHPNEAATVGEKYRMGLVSLAEKLGVAKSVCFINRFLTADELVELLASMDIYVTPYLNAKQITSGTLSYSIGAGKPVISTAYLYAEELLSDGRGKLVPFRDPGALRREVLAVLEDAQAREEMGRLAQQHATTMFWPEVGAKYLACFERAKSEGLNREPIRPRIHPTQAVSRTHSLDVDAS